MEACRILDSSYSDERHHIRATFQLGTSIQVSNFLGTPFEYRLNNDAQLKEVVKLLGADVSSALAGKVIFLDKIGRISDFVEVVLKVGGAFSEVYDLSEGRFRTRLTVSQLSSPAKIVLELAKALVEVSTFSLSHLSYLLTTNKSFKEQREYVCV